MMADELLGDIDRAFAAQAAARAAGRGSGPATIAMPSYDAGPETPWETELQREKEGWRDIWRRSSWIELYFAIQFLWGALIFLPGAQNYRSLIRALPYLCGLALLALYLTRPFNGARPRGSGLLVGALLLLVVNLLRPTSQFGAGIGQCIFQLSIAAPLFWAHKTVRTPQHLGHLIVLVFIMNLASAGLGILQVYFPDRFMPPQFSLVGLQLNDAWVDSLTYIGNDGRVIIRPPGLTDTPGGAALAGGLTALMGLGLLLRTRKLWQMAAIVGAVMVGLAVVYLTQVRSVFLMVVGAAALLSLAALRRRRFAGGGAILGAGAALVVVSFLWASSLGGDAVDDRFLNIRDDGAVQMYQANRGQFLSATVGELLDRYPLGAGVGRWGVMNTYFGDNADPKSGQLWVEIQLTGWLLDGGVLMWILYGGAIVVSILAGFGLSGHADPHLADLALVVIAVQVFVLGMAMAGPAFNTQLGVVFWALAATLYGASVPEPGTADA